MVTKEFHQKLQGNGRDSKLSKLNDQLGDRSRVSWWLVQVISAMYHLAGMFCVQITAFSYPETVRSKTYTSA